MLDQLELQLADLEENARKPSAAQMATADKIACHRSSRKPARRPLPEHLPRERLVYPVPAAALLRRQPIAQDRRGRDRDAGAHSAPVESDPACAREVRLPGLRSDHPTAGPLAPDCARACRAKLLAHVLFAKYGLHLPLNRQGDVYRAKASTSMSRRWRTGWAPPRQP